MSLAVELPGQRSCCTENRMSAFCKFQQHFVRILSQVLRGLFSSAECHFFSEPGPMSDHCPISNFFASLSRLRHLPSIHLCCLFCHRRCLNIDMNGILPVKVSGVFPKLLSRSVTLPQSCNVSNPGKVFHSNSVGSPLIPS